MPSLRLDIRSPINRWGRGGAGGQEKIISSVRREGAWLTVLLIGITIIDQKQNKDVVGPAVAHCHHLLSLLLSLLISDAVWSSVV